MSRLAEYQWMIRAHPVDSTKDQVTLFDSVVYPRFFRTTFRTAVAEQNTAKKPIFGPAGPENARSAV